MNLKKVNVLSKVAIVSKYLFEFKSNLYDGTKFSITELSKINIVVYLQNKITFL